MTLRNRSALLLALLTVAACGDDGASTSPPIDPTPETPVLARADAADAATCTHGGKIVRSGPDRNRDGQLEDGEVVTSTPICLDAPPTTEPPPAVLTRTHKTRPGVCRGDGTEIQSGADRDRDGILDDDEVSATSVVCDEDLLTRSDVEAPGEHCGGGGVAFGFGHDDDGDGKLGSDEVEFTEYECSDVVSRTVEVHTASDLAALAKIRVITGGLVIDRSELVDLALPNLEAIGGRLDIVDNRSLAHVSLPHLEQLGGYLQVSLDPALTQLDAPQLRRVDGDLIVGANGALTTLDGLKNVARIGYDLRISDNAVLTSAPLEYGIVAGDTEIARNPLLAALKMTRADTSGDISVYDNAALTSFQLSTSSAFSKGVIGTVALERNPLLKTVTIYADRVGGLDLRDDAITEVNGLFDRIDGDVTIESAALDKVAIFGRDLNRTFEIGGTVSVKGPATFIGFAFGPVTMGGLSLTGTRIDSLPRPTVLGDVRLEDNDLMTSAELMKVGGALRLIGNDKLTSFWVVDQEVMNGDVEIRDNGALVTASGVQHTREIHGSLTLWGNHKLRRPAMYALERVDGDVWYRDLPALEAFDLPLLKTIKGGLDITETGAKTWAGPPPGFDALVSAAWVDIARNPALTDIGLPKLTEAGDWFFIDENPALTHLGLGALKRTRSLYVRTNKTLAACEATRLLDRVDTESESQSGNDGTGTCP